MVSGDTETDRVQAVVVATEQLVHRPPVTRLCQLDELGVGAFDCRSIDAPRGRLTATTTSSHGSANHDFGQLEAEALSAETGVADPQQHDVAFRSTQFPDHPVAAGVDNGRW